MPIDRRYVEAAYKFILERDPESDEIVTRHAHNFSSIDELYNSFINSKEYSCKINRKTISDYQLLEKIDVEVEVSSSIMNKIFKKINEEWQWLSQENPYWSVLTNPNYKNEKIDDKRKKEFYESGKRSADILFSSLKRNGIEKDLSKCVCFELGTGVGRITMHLANQFKRVVTADISKNMINISRKLFTELSIENVDFVHLENVWDIDKIKSYDVFYSLITLQHNPPPIQYYLINSIAKNLKKGGFLVFQVPFYMPEYRFVVKEYLEDTDYYMEMHALPQKYIYEIFQKNKMTPLETLCDAHTGEFGSALYIAKK